MYDHGLTAIQHKRSEVELLICCARRQVDQEKLAVVRRLLQLEIDWDYLLEKAEKHRVFPLLCNALIPIFRDLIPEKIQKILKSYCFEVIAYNLQMAGYLLKIIELFRQNNILAVPVKGPALAQVVYGNLALREFSDLDIFIHKEDAIKARDLLLKQDYTLDLQLSKGQEKSYLGHENFFSLVNHQQRIVVDLHWELSGRYNLVPITLEIIENELTIVTLNGEAVPGLPLEKMLVYLCVHSSSHCWLCLEWIVCVAELLHANPGINWQQIFNWSSQLHCQRMVLLGVCLSVDLFDVVIPDCVQEKIKVDKGVITLSEEISLQILDGKTGISGNEISWRFSSIHFRVRDSFFDKCHYAGRLFFRPTIAEWQQYPLPSWLSFMYYLLRPYRLVREWMKRP